MLAMPDAPQQSPENNPPAASGPAKTARGPANDNDRFPDQGPAKHPILAIVLASLSIVFLIVAVMSWTVIGDRDKTIIQNQNRLDQSQAAVLVLQTQIATEKAGSVRLQRRMDDTKAESVLLQAAMEKVKAGDVDLQSDLEKARAIATDFQTQMEQAKVESIKHQGEVELAQAQTAVARA